MSEAAYVELVRRTMAELLGAPDVAETDNLFTSGGDSMTAIRLGWRVSKETGIEVNVAEDIMADPTPRAIAGKLARRPPDTVAGAGRR
jgi:acyl carrier protein